jgi:hypothetical protein
VSELPDPDEVRSAATFLEFVVALRATLDEALLTPLPGNWSDERGHWSNWTLASYIEGMASWIADVGRLPLDRESEAVWSVLIPAHGTREGGEAELLQYLTDVASWASDARVASADEPWHAAAEAMTAAVVYE